MSCRQQHPRVMPLRLHGAGDVFSRERVTKEFVNNSIVFSYVVVILWETELRDIFFLKRSPLF